MVPSRAKAPEQSGALLLRMRVRIVRTATRLCAFQDVSLAVDIGRPRLSVTFEKAAMLLSPMST
jgi:propanediol dehydratase small subunit